MTYQEIDAALISITREKCISSQAQLDSVAKERKAERKALQIIYGMYCLCGNAGLLFNATGDREWVYTRRFTYVSDLLQRFPTVKAVYDGFSKEEKMEFLAAWQGELYLRATWLDNQYKELAGAESTGDAARIFEYKIKIDAALDMFAAWEDWRRENGVFPRILKEEKNG